MYLRPFLTPQLEIMHTPEISFSIAEKLAIVQALDALILADGKVHHEEINTLSDLMHRIDFDSNFIVQARNISVEQCGVILKAMPNHKKKALAEILEEMAIADGFVHEKETDLITIILTNLGMLQFQE